MNVFAWVCIVTLAVLVGVIVGGVIGFTLLAMGIG